MRGRWLAAPDARLEPVRGIRPEDAVAYAAWRSDADGIPLGLPTALQWQRMVGIEQLSTRGADALVPWYGTTQEGNTATRLDADHSPFGVRQVYRMPGASTGGEYVRTNDGFAVKGRGGAVPIVSSMLRSEPAPQGRRRAGVGFRLVHTLP